MNTAERAKLDADLAPPDEKDAALAKMNQQVMAASGVRPMMPPPRKRK